jgi:hypothetical protein
MLLGVLRSTITKSPFKRDLLHDFRAKMAYNQEIKYYTKK